MKSSLPLDKWDQTDVTLNAPYVQRKGTSLYSFIQEPHVYLSLIRAREFPLSYCPDKSKLWMQDEWKSYYVFFLFFLVFYCIKCWAGWGEICYIWVCTVEWNLWFETKICCYFLYTNIQLKNSPYTNEILIRFLVHEHNVHTTILCIKIKLFFWDINLCTSALNQKSTSR